MLRQNHPSPTPRPSPQHPPHLPRPILPPRRPHRPPNHSQQPKAIRLQSPRNHPPPARPRPYQPNPAPKIIEGHFALNYPELRELATLKVFISCTPEVREKRRLTRDLANKKGTPEQILAYYQASAIPGFNKYFAPSQIHADLTLSGEVDPKVNLTHILDHLQP